MILNNIINHISFSKACENILNDITCKNLEDYELNFIKLNFIKLNFIRATSISAALSVTISLILYIFGFDMLVIRLLLIISAILAFFATVLWSDFKSIDNPNRGYSWYFELIGIILCVIASFSLKE